MSGAPWLRLVVGLCFPLLVWSILSILHKGASDAVVDGGFGLLLALGCAASLLGGGPKADAASHRGSHAR